MASLPKVSPSIINNITIIPQDTNVLYLFYWIYIAEKVFSDVWKPQSWSNGIMILRNLPSLKNDICIVMRLDGFSHF